MEARGAMQVNPEMGGTRINDFMDGEPAPGDSCVTGTQQIKDMTISKMATNMFLSPPLLGTSQLGWKRSVRSLR